ncbi:endonuclease-8 [Mumia flava]|uniref:DNA-(apurinic or apyrimidinic site) lyase n=1 Tax=Mumia flava TaxID=1348852 RepID=A0A0B2BLF5_9ACTN|nr:DNA-formamidopyrimidine glycosylase family protein [Mumia flava]PJJ56227.1 endonuclease-8 [Mumia flava]
MPEGDAVWRTARRLDRALHGRLLDAADLRVPAYATLDLSGRTVEEVVSRGKHLFAHLGDLSLHTHLGMDGSWRTYRSGARWDRPAFQARVVLRAGPVEAVGFLLPVVEVLTPEHESAVVERLGPDLLDPAYDATEALRRLTVDPARSLADALLDQTVVAGIGNIFRIEVMFLRGLHPDVAIADDQDPARTLDLARRMLLVNRETSAIVTTGVDRRGQQTWVYGRGGAPCRRCGTRIERRDPVVTQSRGAEERVTYWCPHCQPV